MKSDADHRGYCGLGRSRQSLVDEMVNELVQAQIAHQIAVACTEVQRMYCSIDRNSTQGCFDGIGSEAAAFLPMDHDSVASMCLHWLALLVVAMSRGLERWPDAQAMHGGHVQRRRLFADQPTG